MLIHRARLTRPRFSFIHRDIRRFWHPKFTGPNASTLIPIVLVQSGLACVLASLYIWLKRNDLVENAQGKQKIKDSEFTGFQMVHVQSPYLSEPSSTKWCLSEDMFKAAEEARVQFTGNLHMNDVFVASYPKSGTTLLSELVYLLVTKLNWEEASSCNLEERVPFMEYIWPGPKKILDMCPPRVIKTHLPFSFLPEEVQNGRVSRVIYIVRDPRDVVISYYHFARCFVPSGYRNREKLVGFARRFIEDRLPYSPWAEHVKTYLRAAASWAEPADKASNRSFRPKVLVIQFESFKSNPTAIIRQVESFLLDTWTDDPEMKSRKPSKLTDAQIEALVQHCSFDQMSKNPTTNFTWLEELGLWSCKEESTGFMRRGLVGDHRSQLSPEDSESIASKASKSGLEWTLADKWRH